MKTLILFIAGSVFLLSCNSSIKQISDNSIPKSLKGNWYTDLYNGEGIFWQDSLTNYCEIYLTDSLVASYDESLHFLSGGKYHIKNDSLIICYNTDYLDCKESVGHKLLSISGDTIWLTPNPKGRTGRVKIYMVKLPENEKGFYDYRWTNENSDSLSDVLDRDFDRRRWKFYSIRTHDMRGYDSALKAGYWNSKN